MPEQQPKPEQVLYRLLLSIWQLRPPLQRCRINLFVLSVSCRDDETFTRRAAEAQIRKCTYTGSTEAPEYPHGSLIFSYEELKSAPRICVILFSLASNFVCLYTFVKCQHRMTRGRKLQLCCSVSLTLSLMSEQVSVISCQRPDAEGCTKCLYIYNIYFLSICSAFQMSRFIL